MVIMVNDVTEVILVDELDRPLGKMEKLEAHKNGARLHRAFSVFIFNKRGETLLQKRVMAKYHSQGKWSNTCCSHPYLHESIEESAHRRLKEEMGFDCDMREVFNFIYRAEVGNDLTEWEFDHVFFGNYDEKPSLNPEEAEDFKWISLEKLREDIEKNPNSYTPWLKIVLEKVIKQRENEKK